MVVFEYLSSTRLPKHFPFLENALPNILCGTTDDAILLSGVALDDFPEPLWLIQLCVTMLNH